MKSEKNAGVHVCVYNDIQVIFNPWSVVLHSLDNKNLQAASSVYTTPLLSKLKDNHKEKKWKRCFFNYF